VSARYPGYLLFNLIYNILPIHRSGGTGWTADILRYSIPLDKIEKVSSLSNVSYGGLAMAASDGKSIYHFGGYPNTNIVHKLNTETKITTRLPTRIPSSVQYASGLSLNGSIFIFNGHSHDVLEFSEESEAVEEIFDLPFFPDYASVESTAAIANRERDGVWLFGGHYTSPTNPILLFNTTEKVVYIPSTVNTTGLPTLFRSPASVSDGRNGYIIGGTGEGPEELGGILRYTFPIIFYRFVLGS
jgi:hypothetical protein